MTSQTFGNPNLKRQLQFEQIWWSSSRLCLVRVPLARAQCLIEPAKAESQAFEPTLRTLLRVIYLLLLNHICQQVETSRLSRIAMIPSLWKYMCLTYQLTTSTSRGFVEEREVGLLLPRGPSRREWIVYRGEMLAQSKYRVSKLSTNMMKLRTFSLTIAMNLIFEGPVEAEASSLQG